MRWGLFACIVVSGVGLTAISGCGKSGRKEVPTVDVSGTVQMNGKPLPGAEVNFVAEKFAGVGTTGPDGKYQLKAQSGENKVYIRKFPEGYDPTNVGGDTPGGGKGSAQLVPAKYSDPNKTELKFSVPEEAANNADFQLKS